MSAFEKSIEQLLNQENSRFTQDTPIYPEVWRCFARLAEKTADTTGERVDLLLTPRRASTAFDLMCTLAVRLRHYLEVDAESEHDWLEPYQLSASETQVSASLTLAEVCSVALPLTGWWQGYTVCLAGDGRRTKVPLDEFLSRFDENKLGDAVPEFFGAARSDAKAEGAEHAYRLSAAAGWLIDILGLIYWRMGRKSSGSVKQDYCRQKALELLSSALPSESELHLWSIGCNRAVELSIRRSVPAIKADASHLLFRPDTSRLAWAIVDSGIDATHPAFRLRQEDGKTPCDKPFESGKNNTRVVATYDFTRLRKKLALTAADLRKNITEISGAFAKEAKQLRLGLAGGRFLNWDQLLEDLRVDYDEANPENSRPAIEHGTHVAGILGADWKTSPELAGVCPQIRLYDLRVVDNQGVGDEFSAIAALQFIRNRNSFSDRPLIHGVNISMSISHDVRSFACGRTPICEECERLVSAGVVVVAAAGNHGYTTYREEKGRESDGYRGGGITDPGNCEAAITVGATHRHQPHKYGVSFFSSRGPTGDGRMKPDLVAPGEKITAPVPGEDVKTLDGTSMAAPHVSGAAALIMARHTELIGEPEKIKQILCSTATDLGRERNFQGAGMLDILRALQSI